MIPGLILVGTGLFSIVGAVLNKDWFMNNRKARPLVRLLSRNGARVFYIMLGVALVVLGALLMAGVIKD